MRLLEPEPNRRRAAAALVWFGTWLIVTVIALFLRPDPHGHGTHQQMGLPPCPSVLMLDRPCPGCGLTTSWTAFVHGDFARAFSAHALGPVLYLGFTTVAWFGFVGYLRRFRLREDIRGWDRMVWAGVLVFLGYGLIRMAVTPNYGMPHERLLTQTLRGR